MEVCVLGSGSGGNCTYLATGSTRVLVDLGFGRLTLQSRLARARLQGRPIDAILLTHGHCDHVSGVTDFATRYGTPVFMNEGTRSEAPELQDIDRWEPFTSHARFCIGDLEIQPFTIPHDAAEPVGFQFFAQGIRGALVTDVGELTHSVMENLRACDWLVLESNHDEEMVRLGPYPWNVKQRVLSRFGHLSNQSLAAFLTHHFDGHAAHIFLAHLSRQNNDPGIAVDHASRALVHHLPLYANSCGLHLTHQSKPSIVLSL